jgi:phosphatidylglycerophosphate synthase
MTLPNFITIARIFLVPAIVWLLFAHSYGLAFMLFLICLLYTSQSPRDRQKSRMPSSA